MRLSPQHRQDIRVDVDVIRVVCLWSPKVLRARPAIPGERRATRPQERTGRSGEAGCSRVGAIRSRLPATMADSISAALAPPHRLISLGPAGVPADFEFLTPLNQTASRLHPIISRYPSCYPLDGRNYAPCQPRFIRIQHFHHREFRRSTASRPLRRRSSAPLPRAAPSPPLPSLRRGRTTPTPWPSSVTN